MGHKQMERHSLYLIDPLISSLEDVPSNKHSLQTNLHVVHDLVGNMQQIHNGMEKTLNVDLHLIPSSFINQSKGKQQICHQKFRSSLLTCVLYNSTHDGSFSHLSEDR